MERIEQDQLEKQNHHKGHSDLNQLRTTSGVLDPTPFQININNINSQKKI